ncbi:MAG: Trp biosynthesis-associated membrane protein [Agromyces sp.]
MTRSRGVLISALLAAGAWMAVAANLSWAVVTLGADAALRVELVGQALLPSVLGVALVLLGAAGALLLLRGWGRSIVGVLTAIVSAALAWQLIGSLVTTWRDPVTLAQLALEHGGLGLSGGGLDSANLSWTGIPWVTLGVAIVSLVVGLLVAVFSPRWPHATRRFERIAVVDESPAGQWDALTAGDDPTQHGLHGTPSTDR